jgi:hypothetical protein
MVVPEVHDAGRPHPCRILEKNAAWWQHPRAWGLLCDLRAILRWRSIGDNMPDYKSKTGGQDRTQIATGESYELRDWAQKFGVTIDELKAAVQAVGNKATDVEAHSKKSKRA